MSNIIPSLSAHQKTVLSSLFSVIYQSDSYKYSHPGQFVEDIKGMYDYYENRGGEIPSVRFEGLMYLVSTYLSEPFTKEIVEDAAATAKFHGIPFEYDLFMIAVNEYGGLLPLEIKAVDEGVRYPLSVPLYSMEWTDERFGWTPGFVEPILMKAWYMSAVATKAEVVKDILKPYFAESSMAPDVAIQFAYHFFGTRATTVVEQNIVGGMAHLRVFNGTDSFAAVRAMSVFYGEDMEQYKSIAATEHSTTTSAGRENEYEFIERFVQKRIEAGDKLFAAVMDSYNYKAMVERIIAKGSSIRIMLEKAGAKLVLRPDSGDQIELIGWTAEALKKAKVGYVNEKGFYTSDIFSVIWGDGVTPKTIGEMCQVWTWSHEMSMDILAFGSGGDLVQNVSRDSHKTAIKCSSVDLVNGGQRDVFKDPITDPGKASKKGKVVTCRNKNGEIYVARTDSPDYKPEENIMKTVYRVGPGEAA